MNKTITLLLTTLSLFAFILCVGVIACSEADDSGDDSTSTDPSDTGSTTDPITTNIGGTDYVFTALSGFNSDNERTGTLASNVVVSNLMGEGFTGVLEFLAGSVIIFDDMENIVSGTLTGDVGTNATIFRQIGNRYYAFITITPSDAATGDGITDGTISNDTNTNIHFREVGGVDYVFMGEIDTIDVMGEEVIIQGQLAVEVGSYTVGMWLQFLASDGMVHSSFDNRNSAWATGEIPGVSTNMVGDNSYVFQGYDESDSDNKGGILYSDSPVVTIDSVDYVFKSNTQILFDSSNNVRVGTLTNDHAFRRFNGISYVFSSFVDADRRGTLVSNVVVMGLTGTGFTGDVTFAADSVITFDADENILSGTLTGDAGTAATIFRRINDMYYAFITITGDPITEGTLMDGTNTVIRYFRTIGGVDYVFSMDTNADRMGTLASNVEVTLTGTTIGLYGRHYVQSGDRHHLRCR